MDRRNLDGRFAVWRWLTGRSCRLGLFLGWLLTAAPPASGQQAPPIDGSGMPAYPTTGAQAVLPEAIQSATAAQAPAASPASMAAEPAPQAAQQIEAGKVIARVGNQVVLTSDLLWQVNEIIKANRDKIPPGQIDQAKQMLLRRQLQPLIDVKIVYLEALRNIPPEGIEQVKAKVDEIFETEQINKIYEQTGAKNRADLIAKLHAMGTSLEQRKEQFLEQAVAAQWIRDNTQVDAVVSLEEMLKYYQDHISDYQFDAKARWEELMVRVDKFDNELAAKRVIAEMGNEVQAAEARGDLDAFATVAKARSHGLTNMEGGAHDWTRRGSLADELINQAIFTLPVGHLSEILQTERGYHIIRVTERRDAGIRSFSEVQQEVRKLIQNQRRGGRRKEYLDELRKTTPVWTAFDDQQPRAGSRQR